MSIRRSQEWIDIPKGLSIAELMQQNPSKTPPSKIIYEEALTGRTVTYGEFTTLLKHGASHIQQCLGLQPGQVVSIISPSCIDYILAAHAIWWAGGVTSLINDALHADEISYALQMIQPAFVVIHSSLIPSLAQTVCGPYQPFRVFTIGPTVNEFDSFFPPPSSSSVPGQEEALALRPYSLAESDSHAACAAILLSSGTTGRPKAVMLSHYNLVAVCHQLHFDNPDNWRSSQREIFFPPLSHVYGLYVCFTMCYWQGAYVCLMPRFDLEVYCRLMQDRQATLARLVPPVAKALAENPVVRKYRYPNLEYFSCSAAPLNVMSSRYHEHAQQGNEP
jgi:4-coumarate--CoA ligase